MSELFDIAVVGAGAAGTMACLRSVLNGDRTVLFEGDRKTAKRARGTWVRDVENMPGLHGTEHPIGHHRAAVLKWIEQRDFFHGRLERVASAVERIEGVEGGFRLFAGDRSIAARYVIVATGVMDIQPQIVGSIDPLLPFANCGDVIYCIRCDGHRTQGCRVAVVGQDDDAIEIGAILKERYDLPAVAVLTNGSAVSFSDEARSLARSYGFTIHKEAIVAVEGSGQGRSERLRAIRLSTGEQIPCEKAVVSLGLRIHNELLAALGARLDDSGHVIVNEESESSVAGLFVAGDLVAGKKLQIYSAWDSAVDAADEINYRLRMLKRARTIAGQVR